ncbi:membrane fusion protein (multidrug efflux system) [Sinobacterium caligoides]|uniref:Membrane fusion protein (Multidrug efflux system) n=1 Tax=Sinobacterium caligoides TaxID=933926 RepID=A0A3N2E000_9GAMM|nr:efflux RND transporter periplasmic adaptor subunit [Sinobacterium caligoides]ROS05414.1 membrane fusion protein (multidrug efflux system) [Sinobacterium caligoides]
MYKRMTLALIPLMLLGCGGVDSAPNKHPLTNVDTLIIEPSSQTISVELPGRTKAFKEAEVRPQVDGIVIKRLFKEGAFVEEGQSLYQIDPAIYQANVLMAKSKLEAAQATVYAAKTKLNRTKKLVARGAVSEQTLDDNLASYKVAFASLHVAEASLHQATIDLEYTKVNAPISGIISQSYISEGALVTSGQSQMLAKIQQLNPINVDLSRSSSEVLRLKRAYQRGELIMNSTPTVMLSTDTGDNATEYQAQVKFTEVNVDANTDSVTLRAEFPNDDRQLLPGMYVHTRLNIGQDPHAILIPQKSVSRNSKGEATVMLVKNNGIAEQRVIKTAEAFGKQWRVVSGLQANDEIIISNLQRVRTGDKVNVVKPSSKEIKAPINRSAAHVIQQSAEDA